MGLLSWLALTIVDMIILFGSQNNMSSGIPPYVPQLLLIALFAFFFLVFRFSMSDSESIDIPDLLWRVFITGLVATIVSLALRFFMYRFSDTPLMENPLVVSFIYHINIGVVIVFLVSTFVVWKKLTLYQKSKNLIIGWRIFQYSLFFSLFLVFLDYSFLDSFFVTVFAILLIMGIFLSANLKWVAYLNFKQKWKSILLILLSILYLWYFFDHISKFPLNYEPQINLIYNVSPLALFAFIFIYAIFSLLVLLFNLPTSSVFEQKLEEVLNFQRLSQSPQTGQNEEQVYDILLESSVSAVMANAAWLEIVSENNVEQKLLTYKLTRARINTLKNEIDLEKLKSSGQGSDKNKKFGRILTTLKDAEFRSALAFPIVVQNRQVGAIILLKDVLDGFNREMIEIIRTFVSQASISIENFRLLNEAIVNERYKEELKIAKRVQRSLLPESLNGNDFYEIAAFSRAADEVGGDYYDIFRIDKHNTAIIIGDVSGKGTSAAFHMSQMKGIFHSLVQLRLSPQDFIVHANDALSRCLEKSSFITVAFYILNTKDKTIEFARAGHCPTLYFSSAKGRSDYMKTKGLGLGILRNNHFSKYVEVKKINYDPGDVMLLYTDGITEAKNVDNEFFGYERLEKFLTNNASKPAKSLQADLIRELYVFCDKQPPEDDFTSMIIKFN